MSEPAAQASDQELIRRTAGGDRKSFEALAARYQDALYRFTLRVCGGDREAEDALQDGLLAAWRGAATFRGDASARTWLYQVVIHACRRRHRRRAGEPAETTPVEEARQVPAGATAPDERASAREVGAAIDAALARMGEEARAALVLRDVDGLSGEEAAAVLGISLAAMKSRLHRARLELKERVEATLGRPVEEVVP